MAALHARGISWSSGDRRRWIVTAALFLPLVALGVATIRTWRAERRYAVVTTRVIHDYATIAAWQYSRRANQVLHDEAMRGFSAISAMGGAPGGHERRGATFTLKPPAAILDSGNSQAPFVRHARFAFSYDYRSGTLLTCCDSVPGPTRDMLLRRLTEFAGSGLADGEPHQVRFDSSAGASHVIALWLIAAPDVRARAAYGIVADPVLLRDRFARIVTEAPLLPGIAIESIHATDIAVRLARRDGGLVFAAGPAPARTAATDTAELRSANLRATLDLSPRLANALLLVGGAPASQLPSLLLMTALAAILAALGLVQERRARELARLRDRFVANVSHELRTPLAQISMFAETLTLGRERSADEGRRFASIILSEARRLAALVESVLRFSRMESGRESPRREQVSVAGEIAAAVEAFDPIARAAEVTITTSMEPEVQARVDPAAFRQIILNLLDNAAKHGGRGTRIALSATRDARDIRVMVDDSGPGIPAEWRERVFQPFVRMERGGAGGAGIGLAVVRDLVAAHGGRVWIEQAPTGGARFVVALPAPAAAPGHPAEETAGVAL